MEIPNFGTFGTRVVGVKRARKMPIFEVETELADKVNERYRNLKYLVVGRYELVPAVGEEEFKGKEAPYDELAGQVGKEMVLDTQHDVTVDEYEKKLTTRKAPIPSEEKRLMPKLNLRDEATEGESGSGGMEPAPPTLHESEEGGRGLSPLLQVLIAIIILGLLTFALNYFGVIHLWGEKAVEPAQAVLPEPKVLPPVEQPASEEPTPTPTPVPIQVPKGVLTPDKEYPAQLNKMTVDQLRTLARETPGLGIAGRQVATASKDRVISELLRKRAGQLGVGDYTVQVSSWMTRRKADEEASRLVSGGMDAFVKRSSIAGETWHRVRIGRYATRKEAAAAASHLQDMLENHIWVARVSSR